MNRLQKIVKTIFGTSEGSELRNYNPENPSTSLGSFIMNWMGSTAKSGADVNNETAYTLAAVWRCVTLISSTLARLSIEIFEETTDGRTKIVDHPLNKLLSVAPSPLYTPYTFFQRAAASIAINGNFYAMIRRDEKTQRPVELRIIMKPVKPFLFEGYLMYEIEGIKTPFFAQDILHFVGFGDHPLVGKNPIAVHRDTLGISMSSKDYAANLYKNGAFMSGIIESDQHLTTDQKRQILSSFKNMYGGADNAGKVAALDYGFKYKPLSFSPQDVEYIQTQRFQKIEIGQIFGVPPHKMFDMEKSTMNNMEVMNSDFKDTIAAYAELMEQELRRKLFSEAEKGNMIFRFNMYELSRGDMKARTDYYRSRFNTGSITPNEIRKYEGENPADTEGMDSFWLQVNMMRIENGGEAKTDNNINVVDND